ELERLRAIEQLSKQHVSERDAQLDALVTSAMDAIVSLDEEQLIVLFNPAAEKMFHCRLDEVLGQEFSQFIAPQHRESHKDQIEEFVQSGLASRRIGLMGELSGRRRSGEEFLLEGSISQCTVQKRRLSTLILAH